MSAMDRYTCQAARALRTESGTMRELGKKLSKTCFSCDRSTDGIIKWTMRDGSMVIIDLDMQTYEIRTPGGF